MSISIDSGQHLQHGQIGARPIKPIIEMAQTVIEEEQAEV